MKPIFLLLFCVGCFNALAQTPTKFQTDILQFGRGTSLQDKQLIFDNGGGALNKKIVLDDGDASLSTNAKFNFQSGIDVDGTSVHRDGITLGEGLAADKSITVDANLSSPFLKWDNTRQKWVFSNDGSIEKPIGAGAAGAGAITILENGGFEDGIDVQWEYSVGTVTPVSGAANALVGDGSALFDPAALNDYLRTDFITVVKGLRGSACEARFLYTGGDALNYSARVETQSGVILGTYRTQTGTAVLPIHSIPSYESIFFKCPTEADVTANALNGNIRLSIYQGTATNAAPMTVDDAHLGGLIGLVETATPDTFSFRYNGTTGAIITTDGQYPYSCANTGTGQSNCTFGFTFTATPSCVASQQTATELDTAASTTQVFVTSRNSAGTLTNTANIAVVCTKQGADVKQSVQVYKSIPRIAENVNQLTAVVSGGNVVAAQSAAPLFTTCSGTSTKTCNFVSGVFTVTPVCTVTAASTGTQTLISAVSTSSITYTTYNQTGTAVTSEAYTTCKKVEADFKLPTVQPVIIGQVTNSAAESGLTNIRSESCTISNNGTAGIDTSSGLCGWVQSVTRTGTGAVTTTFKSGIFSIKPVCVATTGNIGHMIHLGVTTTTSVASLTKNSVGADTDSFFSLLCTGIR